MQAAERSLNAILGTAFQKMLGMAEFLIFRERGKGFNKQTSRQALFKSLMLQFQPCAIVETGTYLGSTTELMANEAVPIFTVEGNARSFGFARARLWGRSGVTLCFGDSRVTLRSLFNRQLRAFRDKTLFAYLDAHWNADLPLAEELEIVFDQCPAAIVMIYDFQVPFDSEYGYDDFGPGMALTPSYIAPIIAAHRLQAFYPSQPASQEDGARRGCVVLAKEATHGQKLGSNPLLRAA
jgi:hypothetical protein